MRVVAPILAAVIAGVAYTLACPPYEHAWLAWLVPGLLLVPLHRARLRVVFGATAAFTLVFGAGITGWAVDASRVYFGFGYVGAQLFALLVWLVYGGVPFGLMVVAYARAGRHATPLVRPFLAAWLWVAMELLRVHLFTGMPWELLSYTQFRHLLVIQVADVGGAYAVSFVMALVSVAAFEWLAGRGVDAGTRRAATRALAAATAVLVATLLYGIHCRARQAHPVAGPTATLALVQGNVPSALHWNRGMIDRALATYVGLTNDIDAADVDLIVWPEYAIPAYLDREPMLTFQLGPIAARARHGLLLGAARLTGERTAGNAAYLIGARGVIADTYEKQHLVPFAEYDPLAWAATTAAAEPVFAPGTDARPLVAGPLRLGALICYEILYPDLVRERVREGANVLVNLANDSWLDGGDGRAPLQHLSMAVLRAVETRRPLIRVATSAASGFIEASGRLDAVTGTGTAATSVATIRPGYEETVYVRCGDTWVYLGGVTMIGLIGGRRRRRP